MRPSSRAPCCSDSFSARHCASLMGGSAAHPRSIKNMAMSREDRNVIKHHTMRASPHKTKAEMPSPQPATRTDPSQQRPRRVMCREADDLPAPGNLVIIDTPHLAASYDQLRLILNNLCSYAENWHRPSYGRRQPPCSSKRGATKEDTMKTSIVKKTIAALAIGASFSLAAIAAPAAKT